MVTSRVDDVKIRRPSLASGHVALWEEWSTLVFPCTSVVTSNSHDFPLHYGVYKDGNGFKRSKINSVIPRLAVWSANWACCIVFLLNEGLSIYNVCPEGFTVFHLQGWEWL